MLSRFRVATSSLTLGLLATAAAAAPCQDQIPVLTAPTSPAGEVISSSDNVGSFAPWLAFDGDLGYPSTWLSDVFETPAILGFDFGQVTPVDRYTILFGNGSLRSRAPRDWEFQGFDGSEWVTLDTRVAETSWLGFESRSYDLAETAEYSAYRLFISDDNDVREGVVVISMNDLAFESCADELVDDFEDGDFDSWWLDGIGHANQFEAEVIDAGGDRALALTSDGATAYIQRDNGGFLYRELTGDFLIETDIDTSTMTTGKDFRKAGFFMRASLDHLDLRLLAMHLPEKERLQFVARETYGGPGNVKVALEVPGVPSSPTMRLRMERVGQTLTVSYSLDGGTTWTTPSTGLGGSIEMPTLPETVLVGLAVVSNNISVTSTALFDNVLIRPAP
ncbi:MAG: hypothetical protein AAGM22_24260 [Acidobacteriota bacterium]